MLSASYLDFLREKMLILLLHLHFLHMKMLYDASSNHIGYVIRERECRGRELRIPSVVSIFSTRVPSDGFSRRMFYHPLDLLSNISHEMCYVREGVSR